MRWCILVHFKSYSQIKCDYILQDILLFSLAIVQCPRVKSFHINCCLQCSFIYPNTVTSLMFDTFRKYIVKQNQNILASDKSADPGHEGHTPGGSKCGSQKAYILGHWLSCFILDKCTATLLIDVFILCFSHVPFQLSI